MGIINFRKRRKLGLTIPKIAVTAKALKEAGELDGLSREEIAEAIADEIMGASPRAFAELGVDWDSVLAFIEKLLPIILQLIAMF